MRQQGIVDRCLLTDSCHHIVDILLVDLLHHLEILVGDAGYTIEDGEQVLRCQHNRLRGIRGLVRHESTSANYFVGWTKSFWGPLRV